VRRLLLAAGMAVVLHALFLGVKADWLKRQVVPKILPEPLTLSLQYQEPPKKAEVSQEKMPILPIPPIPKIEPTPPAPKALDVPEIPAYTLPEQPPKKKMSRVVKPKPEPRKTKKEATPRPAPADAQPEDWMQIPDDLPRPAQPEAQAVASIPAQHERAAKERPVAAPQDAAPKPPQSPLVEAVPVYRKNPAPRYPHVARRRGYEGTVVLEVLVNEAGRVEDLRLFQSSGYDVLDRAAIKSVQEWVFEPARRGDQRVEMWVQVPVRFQLK
jgi:protein TonB